MARTLATCFATMILLFVLSCNFTPDIEETKIELRVQTLISDTDSFSMSGTEKLPENWWLVFNNQQLNELIEQVLIENFDILVLWDRISQAKTIAERAGANLIPTINSQLGASKTIPEPAISRPLCSLGFAINYEIDLWGRLNNAKKATVHDFLATKQDLITTVIAVTSQLTRIYFEIIKIKQQIELLESQVELNKEYRKLVNLKIEQGQSAISDRLQQDQLILSKQSEITLAKMRLAILEHSIAILLGKGPSYKIEIRTSELPEIPSLPDTGVSTEFLKRRPDVQAAFLRVYSANQRVGEAIANRFPKLSITANFAGDGDSFNQLFSGWILNLGANLLGPIFDGKRLSIEQERTEAAASEKVHHYLKTVANALKEVEDALWQEHYQTEYLQKIKEQSELSRKSLEIIWRNYFNGAAEYISVQNALQSVQSLEIRELEAKFAGLGYRINLYRCLAGSFELSKQSED